MIEITTENIDKYIRHDVPSNWFDHHFTGWRKTRINKLLQVFGTEWFLDKEILELGCGFGHVGKYFLTLGSKVTFAEARSEYVKFIKEGAGDSKIYILDDDLPWSFDKKFDLIIHWGLLYHLKNWKEDIIRSLNHTKVLCLETEVCDSNDKNFEIALTEGGYDQAFNNVGVRAAVGAIENVFNELNLKYNRYDDVDLNSSYMSYTWKEGAFKNNWNQGHRRYWIVYTE